MPERQGRSFKEACILMGGMNKKTNKYKQENIRQRSSAKKKITQNGLLGLLLARESLTEEVSFQLRPM